MDPLEIINNLNMLHSLNSKRSRKRKRPSAIVEDPESLSYAPEIRIMLFGMGDILSPLEDTAELIEKIVLQQIVAIIHKAEEVMERCERTNLLPEDLIFIMRKNIGFLNRLLTYLDVKDKRRKLMLHLEDENEVDVNTESNVTTWNNNRKQYCIDILRQIGIDVREILRKEDSVMVKRRNRINEYARILNFVEYLNFAEARQMSFGATIKRPTKFRTWLRSKGKLNLYNLSESTIEILVFLAKEIVFKIVDAVFERRAMRDEPNQQFKISSLHYLKKDSESISLNDESENQLNESDEVDTNNEGIYRPLIPPITVTEVSNAVSNLLQNPPGLNTSTNDSPENSRIFLF